MVKFKDKVALITGSTRGIGLAIARELARGGAKIVLNGRSREALEKARQELENQGGEVIALCADVSQPEECQKMIEEVIEKFGRLDILVNNAGLSMRANLEELDAGTCKKIVDVNLMGCIYPSLYGLSQIKANRGSLVFISSIAGLIGLPSASLYCATKTALRGFADSLRCELAPEGVHVGIVYVGFTENHPDKKVLGAEGAEIPPERPAHMSQAQVARKVVKLLEKRKNQKTLSLLGKLAKGLSQISPGLIERVIIFSRKHNLGERLGLR